MDKISNLESEHNGAKFGDNLIEYQIDAKDSIDGLKITYQLWAGENQIKTRKLSMYFACNAIFAGAFVLGEEGLQNIIPFFATAFSIIWIFSLGRTIAFQGVWKSKIITLLNNAPRDIQDKFNFFPNAEDYLKMNPIGRISSSLIIIFPPLMGLLFWSILLLYLLIY